MKHIDPFEKNGIFSDKNLPEGIKKVLQIQKMMDMINDNPITMRPNHERKGVSTLKGLVLSLH